MGVHLNTKDADLVRENFYRFLANTTISENVFFAAIPPKIINTFPYSNT